jgi:hypothetical protein
MLTGGQSSGIKIRNNIFVYNHGPSPLFWKYLNISGTTGNAEWTYPNGQIVYPAQYDAWGFWRNHMLAIGQTSPPVVNGAAYPHLDATSEFRNNVLITGNKNNVSNCDTNSTTGCNASKAECETTLGLLRSNSLFGGNVCWDGGQSLGATGVDTFTRRLSKVGLYRVDLFGSPYTSADDIPGKRVYSPRLTWTSPFKSGATPASNALCAGGLCLRATDGPDLGPDMNALEAAQGAVRNVRLISTTSTTATIGYMAPDSAACYVDYRTGTASPQRVKDAGNTRLRTVTLQDLSPGRAYHYIVQCAVEQPSGVFTTPEL